MPRHAPCRQGAHLTCFVEGSTRVESPTTKSTDLDRDLDIGLDDDLDADNEMHATTGGAAAAGALTGGFIGLAGGPVGVALGALGGALVGAAAERLMHSDDDSERARDAADLPAEEAAERDLVSIK
jgi:hypothetical protein